MHTHTKPYSEAQSGAAKARISASHLVLLPLIAPEPSANLYHHFSEEKRADKSRGQKQLLENSDLFQSPIFSPTYRKHGYSDAQESKTIPTVTEHNKQLLKGTNKITLGKLPYVLHLLRLQLEPTKAHTEKLVGVTVGYSQMAEDRRPR